MTLEFVAAGKPEPQGSSKGFVITDKRTGKQRAIVTSDNAKLKPWRWSVQLAARLAMERAGLGGQMIVGSPVHIEARFLMPAPLWAQAKQKRGKVVACIVRPDVDKLARGLMDALTGIVLQDDSLVVDLHPTKRYAVGVEEPGVHVLVASHQPETAAVAVSPPLDEDPPEPSEEATW